MAHIQKLGMINMVTEERGKLAQVAKELIGLLDSIANYEQGNPKYAEIHTKTLDLLKHLANIAGFCDEGSQNRIRDVTGLVTASLEGTAHLGSLRKICGMAVGLQVDFNKSPFMLSEFDANVLRDEFKDTFKR